MERSITSSFATPDHHRGPPPDQFSSTVEALLTHFQEEGKQRLRVLCDELGITPTSESLIAYHRELGRRQQGKLLQRVSRAIRSAREAIEQTMKRGHVNERNGE